MRKYKLSVGADKDMLAIAIYGYKQFGIEQSEAYAEKLTNRFEAITDNPYLYPEADNVKADYRRSRCGSHTIYYQVRTC